MLTFQHKAGKGYKSISKSQSTVRQIVNKWLHFSTVTTLRRVKEKQPTSAQHMWELLQDLWKSIPGEAGWENAKSLQTCHQGKEWLLWRISNIRYIYLFNPFLLTTWFHLCYFKVLIFSLLFYNVENSKQTKTCEWVGVSKLLTGSIYIYISLW